MKFGLFTDITDVIANFLRYARTVHLLKFFKTYAIVIPAATISPLSQPTLLFIAESAPPPVSQARPLSHSCSSSTRKKRRTFTHTQLGHKLDTQNEALPCSESPFVEGINTHVLQRRESNKATPDIDQIPQLVRIPEGGGGREGSFFSLSPRPGHTSRKARWYTTGKKAAPHKALAE